MGETMNDRANKMQHTSQVIGLDRGDEQDYHCKTHGTYRGRPYTITGGRTWIKPACVECRASEKAREVETDPQTRALLNAGIPAKFRQAALENYHTDEPGQERALKIARRYVDGFEERRAVGGSLLFSGETGTGKTHLACAVLQAVLDAGWSVRYTDAWALTQEVKATFTRGHHESEAQAMARYITPDLLVIDEIGVQYGSDTEKAILHRVLDQRYLAQRPGIVIGNLDLQGLQDYLGPRAVSRLHEAGGLLVTFDWEDHRMRR